MYPHYDAVPSPFLLFLLVNVAFSVVTLTTVCISSWYGSWISWCGVGREAFAGMESEAPEPCLQDLMKLVFFP